MANEEELEKARRAHAEALRDTGTLPYTNHFRADERAYASREQAVQLLNAAEFKGKPLENEEVLADTGSLVQVRDADGSERRRLKQQGEITSEDPRFHLFGRVMAKRGPFLVIQTPHGRCQAYLPQKGANLPEAEKAQLANLDLADHVAVHGPAMGTRSGDGALYVESYAHVGKAVLPPPAKWHGLKDVEKRYRERYVDLFANPEVADVFRARNCIVRTLRHFLDTRRFIEVETPLLHSIRGGATAKPFQTHHNALDMPLYLRVAPELYLKRLLVGGLERVYEIGRNFRNEGISTRHNPEFTMLEFYMAYANFEDMMDFTEAMFRKVDAELEAHFGDRWSSARSFSLQDEFVRVRMTEAILERVGRSGEEGLAATPFDAKLNADVLADENALSRLIAEVGPNIKDHGARKTLLSANTTGHQIYALFEALVEEDLTALYRTSDGKRSLPVFVTHFPFEVSPLARRNDTEPHLTDRFELFVEGRELANAFSELNDPDDQASRFRGQLEQRERGDDEAMDFDADYIRALRHGMPPAAGLGLGVDRLCMALCNQSSIRDVLLFPLLRPEAG